MAPPSQPSPKGEGEEAIISPLGETGKGVVRSEGDPGVVHPAPCVLLNIISIFVPC